MVERVRRQADLTMDNLAKAIWNAHPAGEIVLGGAATIKEADVRAAAAILSSRAVPKVGAHPAADGSGQVGGGVHRHRPLAS